MAEYSRRVVHTARVEYFLPNPTNWAEVGKVYSAIKNELTGDSRADYDDTVTVEGRDDELVFSFEINKEIV